MGEKLLHSLQRTMRFEMFLINWLKNKSECVEFLITLFGHILICCKMKYNVQTWKKHFLAEIFDEQISGSYFCTAWNIK